ncbi:transcriptional regulator, TetR family [Thermosinus carboxydivorans Nor1]|uniref:Transcriptional regulator, TetR family n=1 Tax=Thermosinus carboxydivorans Nor1 TaxID=401526 RepID=A1HLV4_9FIRM|nr:TetR/AcrR family transcriptional regulator [Thermosinus carboxydivorans]EAX48808.1 transcriptional regulator, TetR family [Thermosinus carboxydivorans Nor1]
MKERILAAAAQEMNERGVKFTVDAVAARLGISKKTLYQYYPSKDALIAAIIDAALADMVAQKEQILASAEPFPRLLAAVLTVRPKLFGKINDWVMEDIKKFRPQEWQKIERYRREHTAVVMNLLEAGKREGFIRPIHSRVAAQMLLGAVGELLDYRFLAENNLSLSEALDAVTDVFLNGVLTKAGESDNQ